jgi:hypothetical protein
MVCLCSQLQKQFEMCGVCATVFDFDVMTNIVAQLSLYGLDQAKSANAPAAEASAAAAPAATPKAEVVDDAPQWITTLCHPQPGADGSMNSKNTIWITSVLPDGRVVRGWQCAPGPNCCNTFIEFSEAVDFAYMNSSIYINKRCIRHQKGRGLVLNAQNCTAVSTCLVTDESNNHVPDASGRKQPLPPPNLDLCRSYGAMDNVPFLVKKKQEAAAKKVKTAPNEDHRV